MPATARRIIIVDSENHFFSFTFTLFVKVVVWTEFKNKVCRSNVAVVVSSSCSSSSGCIAYIVVY